MVRDAGNVRHRPVDVGTDLRDVTGKADQGVGCAGDGILPSGNDRVDRPENPGGHVGEGLDRGPNWRERAVLVGDRRGDPAVDIVRITLDAPDDILQGAETGRDAAGER
ncbi:hypothetical protein D3C79_862650 [compost metagenome]